jgi:aromatase
MQSFEFTVPIAAPPQRVADEFWNLESWPAVAPHVRAIDLIYADDNVQLLLMTVATRDRIDRFKSVRMREAGAIHYMQPEPPRILRHHHGSWTFAESAAGTVVTSLHTIDVDVNAAREVLREMGRDPEGDAAVAAAIQGLIHNNSLQTMTALKARIEAEESHVHDATA